ncbi:MAG: hypothetical protein ACYDA1_07180, partial [Vulcanimicrobiaceae bacterium]
ETSLAQLDNSFRTVYAPGMTTNLTTTNPPNEDPEFLAGLHGLKPQVTDTPIARARDLITEHHLALLRKRCEGVNLNDLVAYIVKFVGANESDAPQIVRELRNVGITPATVTIASYVQAYSEDILKEIATQGIDAAALHFARKLHRPTYRVRRALDHLHSQRSTTPNSNQEKELPPFSPDSLGELDHL